jgi:hypothetical protein
MVRKIIGVVGFMNSGKGTVGDILNEYGCVSESFARPLKDAVSNIFGWPRNLLEGDTGFSRKWREEKDIWWSEKLGYDVTPRKILQFYGTELFRENFHNDIWILSLEYRLQAQPKNSFVITDVRFPNEIETIRRMGGKIVLVKRGPNPEWYDLALNHNRDSSLPKPDVHYSEWAWIGCNPDYTIVNDGTMKDLSNKVEKMIDTIFDK